MSITSRPAVLAVALAACTVAEKVEPDELDGGVDAPVADAGPDAPTGPVETFLDQAPSGYATTRAVELRFRADRAATFRCAVNGAVPVACASPLTIELDDGAYTFEVAAVAAGVADETPATAAWTTDTVEPNGYFTGGPPAQDNSDQVRFLFGSTEAGTFSCRLDDDAPAPCTSPFDLAVGEGTHSLALIATDLAGQADPSPATWTWTVDLGTPDTDLDSGPSGVVASARADFTFSSDAGPGATFECKLDHEPFAPCTSPQTRLGLGEGAHTFTVRVRDVLGVYDPSPASRSWTVDTTRPVVLVDGPQGAVPSTSATFVFSAGEPATFACRIDASPSAPCGSPLQLTNLAQGAHTLEVFATDLAGNISAQAVTRTWSVDTVPPDTTITLAPSAPTNQTGVTFTFIANEANVTFQCALDDGSWLPCQSPASYGGLADGLHKFAVRAIDVIGHTDATPPMVTWTVDTVAPQMVIHAGPPSTVTVDTATFTFSASEPDATFACRLGEEASFFACTSPQSFAGVPPGSNVFQVHATDVAGNSGTLMSWTWVVAAP